MTSKNVNEAEHDAIFRELDSISHELDLINQQLSAIFKRQEKIAVNVGKLEIKSSIWGMAGAGVIFILKGFF